MSFLQKYAKLWVAKIWDSRKTKFRKPQNNYIVAVFMVEYANRIFS